MVRKAGQTPTMDNREELLDALNDFSRKQQKEIPSVLEQFLKQVAKTGETLFPWTLLKPLFIAKLERVMSEFSEEFSVDQLPPCPNVENARFDIYRTRIMEAVHRFNGAPFTIQRLCELLTDPKRHYKRCDKFMRGLEKNILVVSTVDPFGRKVVSESKNLVNGTDSNNSSDSISPSSNSVSTPPVPSWPLASPSTAWSLNIDAVTPSTGALLEASDLPDPREAIATTSITITPTSDHPSLSLTSTALNGHDVSSSAGGVEIIMDSATAVSSTHTADSSYAASSVITVVTSMSEAVDSTDQHVAAEEMVGEEVEAATLTTISQQASSELEDRLVHETVVETPPVATEELKASTEMIESSAEAMPTASGDWLSDITDKEKEAAASSTNSQDNSDSTTTTMAPDTSSGNQTCTDSDGAVETSANVDTHSTDLGVTEDGKEGGSVMMESECDDAAQEKICGSELKVTSGDERDSAIEASLSSSSKEITEEKSALDNTLHQPSQSDMDTASSSSSEFLSADTVEPTTSTTETFSTKPSISIADTTTSTTSPIAAVERTSEEEEPDESSSVQVQLTDTMDSTDGVDSSSSSISQSAEAEKSGTEATSSENESQQEAIVSDCGDLGEPMEED